MVTANKVLSVVLVALATFCVYMHLQSPHESNSIAVNTHRSRELRAAKPKPSEKKKVGRDLKMDELQKAKKSCQDLADLIYNRYELYDNVGMFFYLASNMSPHAFDIYKWRFAKKITELNPRYLMIFGGTSVTAGHDNRLNSSYPMIAEKRLRPIMEALGIEFKVENIAQPTNNCSPYHYCYESLGEDDPDFVNWEQSYNCGHDTPAFEMTARVAGMSKNRGSIYYSASGAFNPRDNPKSNYTPPYCEEEWTVESVQAPHVPLTHWYPNEADVAVIREKYGHWNDQASSTIRFLDPVYTKSLGPAGFNVWALANECYWTNTITGKLAVPCDGSTSGEKQNAPKPRFFSAEGGRYDNPRGGGAGHHPTKSIHMWRGESIAFMHALSILDAIFMIEKDVQAGKTRAELNTMYAAKLEDLQGPLPEPKSCKGIHCDLRATCYTNYKPHFSINKTLDEVIIGKSEGWKKMGTGEFDQKPWYENRDTKGDLYLKVKMGTQNYFMICGILGESFKHSTLILDMHAAEDEHKDYSQYSFDSRASTLPPLVAWHDRKYVGNECTEVRNVPPGTHILGIARNETLKTNHVASIVHLITW